MPQMVLHQAPKPLAWQNTRCSWKYIAISQCSTPVSTPSHITSMGVLKTGGSEGWSLATSQWLQFKKAEHWVPF